MKKSRFTETQIIKALKENEAGRKVVDLCRELGISSATFYKGRKSYSGMEASQLKELKELQAENSRIKRMYADQALQITMLKDVFRKKVVEPSAKRSAFVYLEHRYTVSKSVICRTLNLYRSTFSLSILHWLSNNLNLFSG